MAICIAAMRLPATATGAQHQEPQVTVVDHDVTFLSVDDITTAAAVHDRVAEGTAVRTGADSRAELTFVDVARLLKTSRFIADFPPLRREKSISVPSVNCSD